MKLKGSHLIMLAVAAITAFVGYAAWRAQQLASPAGVKGEEAFLEEVRQRSATVAPDQGVEGNLMPAGDGTSRTPNIEVERTEIDLGVVANTEATVQPFKIRNTGQLPLRVFEVKTSCPCTLGRLPEGGLTIEPDQEGTMEILIDPFKIPAFEATRHLTIVSNDPDQPQLRLTVSARVDPEFEVTPHEIDFGVVDKGQPYEATLLVRQLQNEPLAIEKVTGSESETAAVETDEVSYELTPVPEEKWQTPGKAEWQIKTLLTPRVPSGTVGYFMYIKSDAPRIPWHKVLVRGIFEAPYTMAPRTPENLGLAPDGTPATITITGTPGIEVTNIRSLDGRTAGTARNGETPEIVYVDVAVPPRGLPGPVKEFVAFDVVQDGVTYPERIRVTGNVTRVAPATATPAEGVAPAGATVTLETAPEQQQ